MVLCYPDLSSGLGGVFGASVVKLLVSGLVCGFFWIPLEGKCCLVVNQTRSAKLNGDTLSPLSLYQP